MTVLPKKDDILALYSNITSLRSELNGYEQSLKLNCEQVLDSFYNVFVTELGDSQYFNSKILTSEYNPKRKVLGHCKKIGPQTILFELCDSYSYNKCIGTLHIPLKWFEPNAIKTEVDEWAKSKKNEIEEDRKRLSEQLANCKKLIKEEYVYKC